MSLFNYFSICETYCTLSKLLADFEHTILAVTRIVVSQVDDSHKNSSISIFQSHDRNGGRGGAYAIQGIPMKSGSMLSYLSAPNTKHFAYG